MTEQIKLIPYTPRTKGSSSDTFLRILVEPIKKLSSLTEAGLLIPGDVDVICETGRVCATCDVSGINVGDIVKYQKMDRNDPELLDTISVEGKKYDVLFENEVWAVNDHPFNRVFVKETSDMSVSTEGLILPETVTGITAKGIVFRAPEQYGLNEGDVVEYRKQERQIYPTISIGGQRYLVMYEAEIFMVNDVVAPYRILVKIDIAAQRIKRSTTASGLILSPLFGRMLHNMQVGEVMQIGSGARKNFPELKVGDQAIIHHRIEGEPHRVVRRDYAQADANVCTFEYRVLDCFDQNNRDIFGRIANSKEGIFVPFGKNVFLDWNFELLHKKKSESASSLLLEFDTDFQRCTDIDDLRATIDHAKEQGLAKAQAKRVGIHKQLAACKLPQENEKYDRLETQLKQSQYEILKIAEYIQANHPLVCTRLGTKEKVIAGYKELYPINVLGKKFLIGYEDFVVAKYNSLVASAANSD